MCVYSKRGKYWWDGHVSSPPSSPTLASILFYRWHQRYGWKKKVGLRLCCKGWKCWSIKWVKMRFKMVKSRTYIHCERELSVKTILYIKGGITIVEKPVKSVGRWYSLPMNSRGKEVQRKLKECLKKVNDKSGIPGKFKVLCFQFGLLPRLMWPIQRYKATMTRSG